MTKLTLIIMLSCFTASAAVLYQDDFTDGNYTSAEGTDGLTWTVVRGTADASANDLRLTDGGLAVTDRSFSADGITVTFTGYSRWSGELNFVFLYRDAQNHYFAGLSSRTRGVYRVMDGDTTQLYADAGGLIALPHASGITLPFKFYVNNTGSAVEITVDKGGDGVDYDVALSDTLAAAVALFTGGAVGAELGGPFDGFEIHDELVLEDRTPAAYYVNAATGDDTRSKAQAQNEATPWATMQTGADSALPGDEVLVAPGIYRESLGFGHGGSVFEDLVIRGTDPDDKPVFDGSRVVNAGAWTETTATDFNGVQRTLYKTTIGWVPTALFLDGTPLLPSQHPNQSDPEDPFNLSEFMDVPGDYNDGSSVIDLVDPAFFTQAQDGYWVGADLMVHDDYNFVNIQKIVDYVPSEHRVRRADAARPIQSGNHYALRGHPGLIDQPGEYYISTVDSPYTIYVMPYAGSDPSSVTGTYTPYALNFSGYDHHITFEGFEFRYHDGNAVQLGNGCDHVTLKDCDLHHNYDSGINSSGAGYLTLDGCYLYRNNPDGMNYARGRGLVVRNCEITLNENDGIYCGGGVTSHYGVFDVTLRGNYIHHQGGRRSHPDNWQMHQVQGVLMQGNVFIQDEEQNMWCQYTDDFRLINNVFMNGPLGINSSINTYLYHNAFHTTTLRYDAHLDNEPTYGDYYKPQHADIRNNIMVETAVAWPGEAVVTDKFAVYTVDNNYFNCANSYTLEGWTFGGYKLSCSDRGRIATNQRVTATEADMSFTASINWSSNGRFIFMYRDSSNYYSFGLGGDAGVFLMLDGTETRVFTDPGTIRLPHARGETGTYDVSVALSGTGVELTVARTTSDGTFDETIVTDDNAAAAALFASGYGIGFMNKGSYGGVGFEEGGTVHYDGFYDADYTTAEGDTGLSWTLVSGAMDVVANGGRGVGVGDYSVIHTSPDSLASVITAAPDTNFENYDFRPVAGSVLLDRAWSVPGLDVDKNGDPRVMGGVPDIGPYEYYTTGIDERPARNALPRVIRFANPARAQVAVTVQGGITAVRVTDVTGRLLAELPVADGRALLQPAAHGITAGLLLLTDGNGAPLGRLVLTQ